MTQSVMDHLNTWNYVVDMDSYELLFVNRKTLELAPQTKLGPVSYTHLDVYKRQGAGRLAVLRV